MLIDMNDQDEGFDDFVDAKDDDFGDFQTG